MKADARETPFQQDIINEMVAAGWRLGERKKYDRTLALYTEDALEYVQTTQPKMWEKYQKLYPGRAENAFIEKLASRLSKVDPRASDTSLRRFGTLGLLRHDLRDKSASFTMCQFRPEHDLNPDTLAMYEGNILRVVPELVYSPWATNEQLAETGAKAKPWRIDLVLFINGIPVVTMELKSEFKQALENAKRQYRETRHPKDPATNRPEPLLTFKRGALVHFAVSQYEVWMTTHLQGEETRFLPFNRGTSEGGAGNDQPEDIDRYATDYLWNEVLAPENLLQIVGRFIHLEIETEEEWDGRLKKVEKLIFPRYHQWDLVNRLIAASRAEGPGQRYLVQHSAGSGKSNSIAWTAHQLAMLHDEKGEKVFHSVIVVTDRTVLDDQLQDTIYQFEHADGVVGRINRKEGEGSKSEKLAKALEASQPIVIVTIQTFPHVLQAIEKSTSLKERNYAIIADEAHSSQSGRTAGTLKEVLMSEASEEELTAEDALAAGVEARRGSANISYYAFTATPKSKTIELFGRLPHPELPPDSIDNVPVPFHVYSMRQAIEEGYILDVLKNYTSYKVAYNLSRKANKPDSEVDARRAKVRLGMWVRLHDYNIAQKVKVIVEHYRANVMGYLNGHAKAMVVTGSRKEAVRYKIEIDRYIAKNSYSSLKALVAFSGEVTFNADDPNSSGLLGEKFTEKNMNPGLLGRDLPTAFDTNEYHVMIVAQKFQTGFDQPKLCAMYIDKKIGGLECVQTLSRLNRVYPGKAETWILDFVNEPEEILEAFQVYYETAQLMTVSDPNIIWDLYDKLHEPGIFLTSEVTQFSEYYFTKSKSNAAISNICRPAVERWRKRYNFAGKTLREQKELFRRAKELGDPVFMANAETGMNEATKALDDLRLFKSDLVTFSRTYEFLSQICDYDSTDLEKLNLYARHLAPLLREEAQEDDDVDLTSVELTHYRLNLIRQQDLQLVREGGEGLEPGTEVGTGKGRSKEEEWLSTIIARLNELFVTDGLTDKDMINYAMTIRDKVSENQRVMSQIENNSPEQALLGDFAGALDDAVISSGDVHNNQMTQYLNSPELQAKFQRLIFDMLVAGRDLTSR